MSGKTKRKWDRAWQLIGYHSTVVVRGLAKVIYGAATAGLMVLSAYGFAMIRRESGWVAVSEFIVATLTMTVALGCVYVFGGRKRRGNC